MYAAFADFYDELMYDVDYKKRTDRLLKLFEKYGKRPELLLDLACGTGGFSNAFANKGIEVIGVDMSEEMLSAAREKSAIFGNEILFLRQKAENLDLYGTVDGAVCCLDSLNHITDYKKFCKALERVSLFLEKGCIFIFDLNTEYKHKNILSDNVFVIETKDIYCVWANNYKEKNNIVNINLDFFVNQNGMYKRYHEEFSERAYTFEEVKNALEKSGFEILEISDDMSGKTISDTTERAVFVVRKER